MFNINENKIWIAGHNGMVGKALQRRLKKENVSLLQADREVLDLRSQVAVEAWIKANRPDIIIIAAAKVGGILANSMYPADFLYDNVMIAYNIIHAAYLNNIKKLLFLGSSCIYPRDSLQPIQESSLLTGSLEITNQWYAIAKISGLKLAEAYRNQYGCDFISAMPTNLYGLSDTYHSENSHVIPALIMKIHEAKQKKLQSVTLWGNGKVYREFLYVDDLADACIFLLKNYSNPTPVNVGTGRDISIQELAILLSDIIGYTGEFKFDLTKPSGTPKKLLDISKIQKLGWLPITSLRDGLKLAYDDFLTVQNK